MINPLFYEGYVSPHLNLTHLGRETHICVSDLTSIGSDNGLSPGRRQAIIKTNAGILLIRPLWTNFSEFLVEILIFSFKKMRLKVSSAKRRPFCLGLYELSGRMNSDCSHIVFHSFGAFNDKLHTMYQPHNVIITSLLRQFRKTKILIWYLCSLLLITSILSESFSSSYYIDVVLTLSIWLVVSYLATLIDCLIG